MIAPSVLALLVAQAPLPAAAPCPPPSGASRVATCILHSPAPRPLGSFGTRTLALSFDDDPHPDLAVAEPAPQAPGMAGRVWVFRGPSFDEALLLVPQLSQAEDRFGTSLAAADLDGDGRDELVVGAPHHDAGPFAKDVGFVSIWSFKAGGPTEWMQLHPGIPQPGGRFGTAVAVGNVIGAARVDVAVGTPFRRVTGTTLDAGTVSVFAFHPGPIVTETIWENPKPSSDHGEFGNRLAVTDWNGDGLDDLVVAAIFNDVGAVPHGGQVFVLGHVAEGAPATILARLDNPYAGGEGANPACVSERYGMTLDAGDLDGDGFGEVLVGANRDDHQGVCEAGRGSLFSGAHAGGAVPATLPFVHPTPAPFDLMAYRVDLADIVGGPELDVVVGSAAANQAQVALVWDGAGLLGPGGFPAATPLPVHGFEALHGHGPHSSGDLSSGDLDRDGREELILGDYDAPLGPHPRVGRVLITWWP
ncbi:MAG: FG-GAP and VCBS repeat-containing protein [Planctomycetota bacterium JB042]